MTSPRHCPGCFAEHAIGTDCDAQPIGLDVEPEALAQMFHENYERLAPTYHYGTRPESAVPWEDVPVLNKGLMIATARAVLAALANGEVEP